MNILITGQPNVGKTLFVLSIAQYYKLKNLTYTYISSGGVKHRRKISITDGLKQLVDRKSNHTKNLYSFDIPVKKRKRNHGY